MKATYSVLAIILLCGPIIAEESVRVEWQQERYAVVSVACSTDIQGSYEKWEGVMHEIKDAEMVVADFRGLKGSCKGQLPSFMYHFLDKEVSVPGIQRGNTVRHQYISYDSCMSLCYFGPLAVVHSIEDIDEEIQAEFALIVHGVRYQRSAPTICVVAGDDYSLAEVKADLENLMKEVEKKSETR